MSSAQPTVLQRRIAVLGFRGVGKSALATQFVEHRFVADYDPTIENTFQCEIAFPECNVTFQAEIIDTAGQDEYSSLSRKASVGVHGYMLVYSVCSQSSFAKLGLIRDRLLSMVGSSRVPVVLVGNKMDSASDREVSTADGRAYADGMGCPFLECSAKTNANVADAFRVLLREIEKDSGVLKEKKKGFCTLL